ncbi:MAG: alcohol dehydrogenase catalytic domain-containing protein [Armatimonadetes bacterium]|nr:alcohol dehydrogenase catalytic domain-containing protein [Armatimonadota bacterium]
MTDPLRSYKAAQGPIPPQIKRWHLTGAGFDALHEVTVPLPRHGPDELLVRHDAVGICFSDIKIIAQGPAHPKLYGRDMEMQPVVMGHEVALTVVGVGENLRDMFAVGQRFLVQADIYRHGVCIPYGYVLPGGMAQYGVVTQEALNGDHGCYLLPLADTTGFAEAALVEPWACVVAAYRYPNYRPGPKPGGRLLVVNTRGVETGDWGGVSVRDVAGTDFARLRAEHTGDAGFDDVIVFGTPSPADLGRILTTLGSRGILNLVLDRPLVGPVPVDVGRVHYEQHLFVSATDPARVLDAYQTNTRQDLKPGGAAWLVGAGGPMGQMHLERLAMLDAPPRLVLVTDSHDERLERIQERFEKRLAARGITLVALNRRATDEIAAQGPFDDIISMASSAESITEALPYLSEGGVYNLFAGLAKGTITQLGLGTMLTKNQRMVGTSGSTMDDIRQTLGLVESGRLSTNSSVAAIGGLSAYQDGLLGVKNKRFPGKTVIFPQIEDLPLTSLEELSDRLPNVHARLRDGLFWTREAEEELLREKAPQPPILGEPERGRRVNS